MGGCGLGRYSLDYAEITSFGWRDKIVIVEKFFKLLVKFDYQGSTIASTTTLLDYHTNSSMREEKLPSKVVSLFSSFTTSKLKFSIKNQKLNKICDF